MCRRRFYLVASILVLATCGAAQAGVQKWESVVQAANPIHWYRFNEAPGTTTTPDNGSGGLNGEYRSLVDLGQEGLFGPGEAALFERGGQEDVMWTQGGDLTSDEWTAEFIVMKMSNTVAQALTDSADFSLRIVGWGVDEELSFTEYGVIDARFDAVAGADLIAPVEQWIHVTYRKSGSQTQVFVDGVMVGQTSTLADCPIDSFGGRAGGDSDGMDGFLDEAVIYDYALTDAEVLAHAMAPFLADVTAIVLEPEDGATDVPRDTTLSWMAGAYAQTHDVYFGTVLDDVDTADRDNPLGVLVSQGQTASTYEPVGNLELGQTYYWRIDEVNGAPDNTIFKGDPWSFTVEPVGYPIENIIATSNGAPQADAAPENMVNGSGLNADDQHSTDSLNMWLASPVGDEPMYIQFEFDRVYKMHEMVVWNYNVEFELLLGFGIANATVEYSENGIDWTALGDVELTQATARSDYAANTTIDLQGVAAQFVKLTVNSGFGTLPVPQYGLSEVRFLFIPAQAREPQPDDGATDVAVDAMLGWRAGRDAVSHEVSFGTDPNALALAGTADAASFDPGALDLGTTYYWQVDAIQEAESWAGALWSFSTQTFVVVDDFESYTDDIDAGEAIFLTWIDGYEVNGNGSTVGHMEAPFAEMTIVHGGAQSMPLFYDNTNASVSEAELALAQNWTLNGIESLSIFFQGAAGNTGQLYVKINGTKVAYDGAAGDIAEAMWMPWNIDLSTVGGNMSNVTSLIIGVEGAGATGVVYIDDVRLYPNAPELITPTEPDEANLVAHYAFDGDFSDSAGSHNAAPMGDAQIASDPDRGQVLSLDGGADAVEIGFSAELNPEAFTVSIWANPDPAGSGHRSPITSRDDAPQRGYIIYLEPGNTWQFWTGTGTGWNNIPGPTAALSEWTHLAATFANEAKAFYVNGRLVGQSTAPLALNTEQVLRIGGGATEGPGDFFFQGMLDEARVYNRALSAAEAAGLAGRTAPLHKPF